MKRQLPVLIILCCAAALVFGVIELFNLRFQVGDVYPPYSSLRSDPLGTMAFYESLDLIPGVETRRDYSVVNQLPEGKNTTYMHLASDEGEWSLMPRETETVIEQFLQDGGRLVVTMRPESSQYVWRRGRDEAETNSEPSKVKGSKEQKGRDQPKEMPAKSKRKSPIDTDEDSTSGDKVSLADRWGLNFDLVNLSEGESDSYGPVTVTRKADLTLPKTLEWHSGIVFTNLDKSWKTFYARGTNAVVIERKFGAGTVVFATDSYFLSNEAMVKDRHAEFLAWLVGPNRNVVFDEAHLGVTETPGIAGLMRKYRLEWLAAGLILLAGLFIWKNSFSLVPPHEEEERREFVVGKDAASGFVNLLRRSISSKELLATCFSEWKKSVAQPGKYSASRIQQAGAIFQVETSQASKDQNPVRAYQNISRTLQTRNPESKP